MAVRVIRSVDKVLGSLSSLASTQLSPADGGYSYDGSDLGECRATALPGAMLPWVCSNWKWETAL